MLGVCGKCGETTAVGTPVTRCRGTVIGVGLWADGQVHRTLGRRWRLHWLVELEDLSRFGWVTTDVRGE